MGLWWKSKTNFIFPDFKIKNFSRDIDFITIQCYKIRDYKTIKNVSDLLTKTNLECDMTHKKNKVMAYISKANDPNYNEIN